MRPIKQCLNPAMITLCQRVRDIETLQTKIKLFLPEELREVCNVGSFNKGCLLLTTTDAVWATQLRFMKSDLRDRLRIEGGLYQLISIDIKIITPPKKIIKPQKNKHVLSEFAQDVVNKSAEECQYLPLKKALKNLAKV